MPNAAAGYPPPPAMPPPPPSAPLPPGYQEVVDPGSGATYFYNAKTGGARARVERQAERGVPRAEGAACELSRAPPCATRQSRRGLDRRTCNGHASAQPTILHVAVFGRVLPEGRRQPWDCSAARNSPHTDQCESGASGSLPAVQGTEACASATRWLCVGRACVCSPNNAPTTSPADGAMIHTIDARAGISWLKR
eukprot:7378716-Prymnesium_polylepis.1